MNYPVPFQRRNVHGVDFLLDTLRHNSNSRLVLLSFHIQNQQPNDQNVQIRRLE